MSITNNQSSSNPKTLNFFWNDTRHPPEKRFKAATKYLTQKLKSFEEQNFENLSDFLRNIPKFLVLSISSEKDQLRVRDYRKILQNCWPNWQSDNRVECFDVERGSLISLTEDHRQHFEPEEKQ